MNEDLKELVDCSAKLKEIANKLIDIAKPKEETPKEKPEKKDDKYDLHGEMDIDKGEAKEDFEKLSAKERIIANMKRRSE